MDIKHINTTFNNNLQKLAKHKLKVKHLYCGLPSTILLLCGLKNVKIEVAVNVITGHLNKHNISVSELNDLPLLLQEPVMVFYYIGKGIYAGSVGFNIVIKRSKNKQLMVIGIHPRGNGAYEINDIRTFHYRKNSNYAKAIAEGKLLYAHIKSKSVIDTGEAMSPGIPITDLQCKDNIINQQKQIFCKKNIIKFTDLLKNKGLGGIADVFNGVKYFKPSEFDSPDLVGSGHRMSLTFVKKLDKARAYAGVPFIILSGYRTKQHNKYVGGVAGSEHTTGHGADIVAPPQHYNRIIQALIKAGIKRIGLNNGSIHAGDDPTKPSPAVWIYYNTASFKKLKKIVLDILKKKVKA